MKEHSSFRALINSDWESMLSNISCGFLLTDGGGLIKGVNQTLLNWLGYERAELVGEQSFQELLPFGGRLFYETRHLPLMKLQEGAKEVNYNMLRQDGELLPVLINSDYSKDSDGNITQILFIIFPYSDRKKHQAQILDARKKAEEASAAKTVFLTTVTHELRTPIHSIMNAANLLRAEDLSPQQEQWMELLEANTTNLLLLINSILDLSKMESKSIVFKKQPSDLQHVLSRLLKIYQSLAEGKGLSFQFIYDDDLPPFVIMDGDRLQQVLTNLIGNAIKFTK
ncbi:MAG: histidine kinase dimerization/phospho-acceptor domain-containing protein, partial [Bacteroidota bacterium]